MPKTINERINSAFTASTIGPLKELYKNRFTCDHLSYPRDLGTSHKGHVVSFNFFDVAPMGVEEIKSTLGNFASENAWSLGAAGAGAAAGAWIGGTGSAATTGAIVGFMAFGGTTAIANSAPVQSALSGETTGIEISPPISSLKSTVKLYMPDSLEFSQQSDYSNLSIAEAVGSSNLTGAIGRAVTSITNDDLVKLALNKAGYVFNPQQQLLFNGIDFRTYEMSFTFTPYSKAESEQVKNIIQTFRRYAAPTVVTGAAGFFFNPPGVVEVKYLFNGVENLNLHKLKRSVIESVNVNYAPNGWAAMRDGMPSQITMTVAFKEMQLVDRKDIERGY
jgi:hypothetical protein